MVYFPSETWHAICENLEPADIGSLRLTSKRLARLAGEHLYRELCVTFSEPSIKNFCWVAYTSWRARWVKRIVVEDAMFKYYFRYADALLIREADPTVTQEEADDMVNNWRNFAQTENVRDWNWVLPYIADAMRLFVKVEDVEFHHGLKQRRPVRHFSLPQLLEGSWDSSEYQHKMWYYRGTDDAYEPSRFAVASRSNVMQFIGDTVRARGGRAGGG